MNNDPVLNTDKELWREIPNDYYSPSIFVTEQNSIGINVGGWVYVKPVEDWHKLAEPAKTPTDEEIDYITKKYFNIHPEAKLSEQFKIKLYELEDFARAILKKASEK
jgi:hypothetical protein